MRYVVTAGEINERGCWEEFCEMFCINPWAMSEGLMESSEEFKLTAEQAKKLGLIKDTY